MSEFIMPLDFQTWFVQVFAGDLTFFLVIMAFVILSLGAYFRMKTIIIGSVMMLFFVLFQTILPSALVAIGGIIIAILILWPLNKVISGR